MSTRLQSRWGWLFLGFPLLGVTELQAHLAQRAAAPTAVDFVRAKDAAGPIAADETVVFAPRWADPLGREAFSELFAGDLERAAPADLAKYAHVLEVAERGARETELGAWPVQWEKPVGRLTLRMHDNPTFSKVTDALMPRVGTDRLVVTQGGKDCPLVRGTASAGAWSIPTPAVRYACSGGAVGHVVIPDQEYRLRHCLLASAGPAPLRIRFVDVAFGGSVRVAYGLHSEGERQLTGAPVDLRVLVQTDASDGSVTDVELGKDTHRDGEGWKYLDVATASLRGQTGDLHVELVSTGAHRPVCFEAFAR